MTVQVLKPELMGEYVLSLPLSSFLSFRDYARFLVSKDLTPQHVISRLKTTLKQFKKGNPVSVVVFEPVKVIEQQEPEAVNVTPKEEPAPQPVKAPVEDPQQSEIPQEWA